MKLNWRGVVFIVSLVVLWQVVSTIGVFNESLFPSPPKVFSAFLVLVYSGELLIDIFSSLWRVLLGLAIGSVIGVVLGLLVGRTLWLDKIASPTLNILRALPPVAIIPLMIVWFGIGDNAKIIEIAFAVFFPVWISTLIGAKSINENYLRTAKIFVKSKQQALRKILFPATLPFIANGIRIGIAVAFIMVFVSELAGASSGLGYLIAYAQIIYRADIMFVGLIVLGLLAAATDQIFIFAYTKKFPWVNKNGE
ncbi:MAG: ABC transporter permease [archaeon]|jgi:ABC-type nitrate/sulfonate/bicarbonate transport system permease component